MIGGIRLHWVALACLAAAAFVGVAAVVDHHAKQGRIDEAQVDAYFCRVQHLHCGGASWRRIESAWQRRQMAYESAVIVLGGLGLMGIGYSVVRRSRQAPTGGAA